jgi:hypothetical protein
VQKEFWGKNKDACNLFVIAVAREFGCPLAGSANDIVNNIKKQFLEVESGAQSARWAAQGVLVVAGLHSSEYVDKKTMHGHVAVVVPGDLYLGKYPKVWCGSIGTAQSEGDQSVGEVWKNADRDKVHYYKAPSAGQ